MIRTAIPLLVLLSAIGILSSTVSRAQHAPVSHDAPQAVPTASVSPDVARAVDRALTGPDGRGKDGPMAPVGRRLATLYHVYENAGADGVRKRFATARGFRQNAQSRTHAAVSPDGRHVTIDAVAAPGQGRALLASLRGLGLANGSVVGRIVSGRLPIRALRDAAQRSTLRAAFPSVVKTHVGTVQTQGDSAHNADGARRAFGVDGAGVKVCAISDSYDNANEAVATSAADDVQSGDLPGTTNPNGFATPVDVLNDSTAGSDEGRAMLQLVHDVAPGAPLGFRTGFDGAANFAQGIRDLADAGCAIIVDDLRYSIEPFYQDGIISQAVDDVVEQGVAYFSSAGNEGQDSYQDAFRDSGRPGVISPDEATLHDFDPSGATDTRQRITIDTTGGTFEIFSFQWTDPSAFAGAGSPDTDIDVALLNDTLGVVDRSIRNSIGNGVPVENLSFTNSGTVDTNRDGVADSTFHLVVERFAGPAPDSIKYVYSESGFDVKEFDTLGPTVYGHPRADGAMAVAAAPFFNTSPFNDNVQSAVLEPFSSRGGVPILFTPDGVPTGPTVRPKPDVTGADAGNTTFFGSDLPDSVEPSGDTFPNFAGTSAAAPHVAAIAALVWDNRPGLSVTELYRELERNAQDVTRRFDRTLNVAPTGPGVDAWSGHGFVRARSATLPVELTGFTAIVEQQSAVLTWTTASERNNAGFAVEHRAGDGSFTRIGFVEGAGTTAEPQRYRFRTDALSAGPHAFRLRQTDTDGSTTLSRPVTVRVALSGAFQLSGVQPNPVRQTARVTLTVDTQQPVRATVFNVLGQRVAVLHDESVPARDPHTFRIDGADLPSGVYFLRVDGASFTATRKFVRVR